MQVEIVHQPNVLKPSKHYADWEVWLREQLIQAKLDLIYTRSRTGEVRCHLVQRGRDGIIFNPENGGGAIFSISAGQDDEGSQEIPDISYLNIWQTAAARGFIATQEIAMRAEQTGQEALFGNLKDQFVAAQFGDVFT